MAERLYKITFMFEGGISHSITSTFEVVAQVIKALLAGENKSAYIGFGTLPGEVCGIERGRLLFWTAVPLQ